MVDARLRAIKTETEVLISNLRGEIGEVITSWVLLNYFMAVAKTKETDNIAADIKNQDLAVLYLLKQKLKDELVAKLSELADPKIGRTNFYFASMKLGILEKEVKQFKFFIIKNKLQEKRNREISHREQPEVWPEFGPLRIPYRTVVKATGMAVRLMKKFDQVALGPNVLNQWHLMRKKRYEFSGPPRAMYLLLPYMVAPGRANNGC